MLKELPENLSGGVISSDVLTGRQQSAEYDDDHERAHGEYETVKLYSDQFVKLSQIRGTKNKVSAELKESIRATGLMNQIDVARMTRESLAEYIGFTNETWGADASIDDFGDKLMPDGHYYLIVAGHSRHEAIIDAENDIDPERKIQRRKIMAKVHEVNGPADIIELQQAENISSVPPQERVAIATVEVYNWGLRHGKWSNKGEFLKQRGAELGVTRTMLTHALSFQDMPKEAREFVLSGKLKYLTGVELGASVDVLRDYVAVQNGFSGSDDPRIGFSDERSARLERIVTAKITAKANDCIEKNLNSTAGKKMVSAWRSDMRLGLRKLRGEKVETLDLEMVKPEENLVAYEKEVQRVLTQQLSNMARFPAAHYKEAIELNRRIVGNEATDEALRVMEENLKRTLTELGVIALQPTVQHDEQQLLMIA